MLSFFLNKIELSDKNCHFSSIKKSPACDTCQPVPNGYPIPNPNFLSIPDPYPNFFQNPRVFQVSGISESINFFFDPMCCLFEFWPVSFNAIFIYLTRMVS